MFGQFPQPRPKRSPGVLGFLKTCYSDSSKWDIIKSWTIFAFGVFISKDVCAIDLTTPSIAA